MINGNNDNVALTAEIGTVIGENLGRRTCGESAAVQPDHDGAFLAVRDAGRPDVEILTVVVQASIDYIDWKQGFYDDVLSGRTPYISNLLPNEADAESAEESSAHG